MLTLTLIALYSTGGKAGDACTWCGGKVSLGSAKESQTKHECWAKVASAWVWYQMYGVVDVHAVAGT